MGGLDSSRASVQVIGNPGLLREGICAILKEMADVKCVERPRDLQDALAACEVCRPEILVIEDSPPQLDGLLAVDMFRQKCGLVQAILFSSAIGGALVKRAFKAIDFGATGYISTSDTKGAIEAINKITVVITQINEISGSIASAVEEQTATTNEISRNIAESARGASEIASNITSVATTAQSTTEGANNSQTAALELARMAATLQQIVNESK